MEATQTRTEQTDSELSPSEQLYRIEQGRNDDGTVEAVLTDWERDGGDVLVEFELPTGDVATECMDWPWPMSDDPDRYKFVRIAEQSGYGLVSADGLKDGSVDIDVRYDESGGWEVVAPRTPDLSERVGNVVCGHNYANIIGWITLFPLFFPLGVVLALNGADDEIDLSQSEVNELRFAALCVLSFALWAGAIAYVFL